MDLAVFAAYFILVIAVAVKAARQTVSTKRDYFLAGDKLPWWMIGGSIIASNIRRFFFSFSRRWLRAFVVCSARLIAVTS